LKPDEIPTLLQLDIVVAYFLREVKKSNLSYLKLQLKECNRNLISLKSAVNAQYAPLWQL